MKSFGIFVVALIAGAAASAVPEQQMEQREAQRWITGAVAEAVEDASQTIKDLGLDPYNVQAAATNYGLPVPQVLSLFAGLEDLLVVGLSDIVVNQASYWVITGRANVDVSLPHIELSLRNAAIESTVLNKKILGHANGKLVISNIGLKVEARVSIGIISGVTIRDITANFYIGAINSQFENIVVLGTNYAVFVNNVLNINFYNAIVDSYPYINELIEIVAWQFI